MNESTRNRIIAQALCDVSHQVLWELYSTRIRIASPRSVMRTRIGSGKATNHRLRGNVHTLTYGVKMVANKMRSKVDASGWTTGREITQRGFANGEMTLLNAMAHTALHEFAHLVQRVEGGREYRSVHNAAFYSILRGFYRDGTDQLVREFIQKRMDERGIKLEWGAAPAPQPRTRYCDPFDLRAAIALAPPPRTRPRASADTVTRREDFAVGDRVSFNSRRGERIVGRIIRLNRKTVSVQTNESEGWWRVSRRLLTKES